MFNYKWTYRFNYIGTDIDKADMSIFNWTYRFYYIGTDKDITDMSIYNWTYRSLDPGPGPLYYFGFRYSKTDIEKNC